MLTNLDTDIFWEGVGEILSMRSLRDLRNPVGIVPKPMASGVACRLTTRAFKKICSQLYRSRNRWIWGLIENPSRG